MSLLGERLRELRMNRSLTLKQVSEDTGLSVSFLSLVERDKVSISVDNLERLARFYSIRMVHLFQGVEDSSVFLTRGLQARKTLQESGFLHPAFALLSYRTGSRMEPLLVQVKPGAADAQFRVHDGDIFLYVLEGNVRLYSEKGENSELCSGDSAYYYGFPGRKIENSSQEEPALILLVTSPPSSLRDEMLEGSQGILLNT